MAFSDITSREAVLQAIAECDDLGRKAFLAKYGFGVIRHVAVVVTLAVQRHRWGTELPSGGSFRVSPP